MLGHRPWEAEVLWKCVFTQHSPRVTCNDQHWDRHVNLLSTSLTFSGKTWGRVWAGSALCCLTVQPELPVCRLRSWGVGESGWWVEVCASPVALRRPFFFLSVQSLGFPYWMGTPFYSQACSCARRSPGEVLACPGSRSAQSDIWKRAEHAIPRTPRLWTLIREATSGGHSPNEMFPRNPHSCHQEQFLHKGCDGQRLWPILFLLHPIFLFSVYISYTGRQHRDGVFLVARKQVCTLYPWGFGNYQ